MTVPWTPSFPLGEGGWGEGVAFAKHVRKKRKMLRTRGLISYGGLSSWSAGIFGANS